MINNNEKGQILYGSLLPILVVVGIIAGAGFFLLRGEYELPKLKKDPTEIRRLEGLPTIVSYTSEDEPVEKQREVIRSQEELNNFLNTIDPSGKLILKEDINFNKEMLIAVATETNETYGYEMKIKKVFEDQEDGSLLVSVKETRPGDNCDEDKVPNSAVDIVAITKNDMQIDFERLKEVYECEDADI